MNDSWSAEVAEKVIVSLETTIRNFLSVQSADQGTFVEVENKKHLEEENKCRFGS